ncbi:MAG: hypothetical protein O7E52_18565 [Candidatus Poribacteria bacterium]|nr:hypothetical protein [Candidatus Poribacteria bacterium]
MKSDQFLHAIVLGLLISTFSTGCSIRFAPLGQPQYEADQADYEREEAVYDEYYPGGSPPPDFFYNTWQMSQYYRYANERYDGGHASGVGYLPSDRMNIDPNPNDSYRTDEAPVRRALSRRSLQPAEPQPQHNHRAEQRRNSALSQRTANRSRSAHANLSSAEQRNDGSDTRQRLKERRNQSDTGTKADEERQAQRRKVRRRARR